MISNSPNRYINIVPERDHGHQLTMATVTRCTENFTKPALFRNMAAINPQLTTRAFFDAIEPDQTLQWRRKSGTAAVSMRSRNGKTDFNYVSGHVGTGAEFLDDIFERKLDVYSLLGTIAAGYKDPYEWGKVAFQRVQEEVFRSNWFQVEGWQTTGHIFLGY